MLDIVLHLSGTNYCVFSHVCGLMAVTTALLFTYVAHHMDELVMLYSSLVGIVVLATFDSIIIILPFTTSDH